MSTIKDGGPAFPMQDHSAIHAYASAKVEGVVGTDERDRVYVQAKAEAIGGMSLRDYFAAKALAQVDWHTVSPSLRAGRAASLAAGAYVMADAMLAAREKGVAS